MLFSCRFRAVLLLSETLMTAVKTARDPNTARGPCFLTYVAVATVLSLSFICSASWANEDQSASLHEEVGAQVDDQSGEGNVPQAENVDLREVISEPLNEALPINEEPVAEAEVPDEPAAQSTEPTAPPATSPKPAVPAAKVLLGTEVPPGTATRLAWSVKDTLAGISVPTPVLVVHGHAAGPTVCLTGAVHGDELNGIEVVRKVLYELDPNKLKGTVIGVPIVNLQGFRRASRYLQDRRDLNRYFPGSENGSSAARIAHSFFSNVVSHCTYLIDLHTGSFRRTNLPQLRADLTNADVTAMTRDMGPIVVLQSQGARGSLRREALEAGIPAVTIEAGEPLHIDLESVNLAANSVQNFLHKQNMYEKKGLWARKTEPVYYKSRWVRAARGGILLSKIKLGERVNAGQKLGVVTDPITNASSSIESPIDGQVIGMALNQIMLPGFAAYHIGFQASIEEAASEDVGPDDAAGDEPMGEAAPQPNHADEPR